MVDSRNTDRSKRSGLAGTVVRFGIFVFEKFAGSGVTPNQITLGGLLLVAGSCLAYWLVGDPFWLGAGLALAFTTDALDGAVARHQNKVSAFGGYLDAVTDRYQETLVYLTIGVVTGWWVPVFLTMSGSMLTSYNKARAAIEMPIRNKGWPDLLERPRRLWILCVALILDGFVPLPDWLGGSLLWLALVALAVLTHFTAVQRFFRVQRMFGAAESAPRDAG